MWLRTGMHAGRETNLNACNILKGFGKRNLYFSIDGDNLHLKSPGKTAYNLVINLMIILIIIFISLLIQLF